MRIVLVVIAFMFGCVNSQAQSALGGEIRGRTQTGTIKSAGVDSLAPNRFGVLVSDSVLLEVLRQMKTSDSVHLNLANQQYNLLRNQLSNPTDNNLRVRDTTLIQVQSGGRLKVTEDSTLSRSTVKVSEPIKVDSLSELHSEILFIAGELTSLNSGVGQANYALDDLAYPMQDSLQNKLDTMIVQNKGIDNKLFAVNANASAIYSKLSDSIRVFATNGFGSSGGSTSLDAVDSTNLARSADSAFSRSLIRIGAGGNVIGSISNDSTTMSRRNVQVTNFPATQAVSGTVSVSGHDSTTDSRRGVVLLVNPTVTNDSSTMSRTTVKISSMPSVTVDSTTASRRNIQVTNFPATQAVTGTFWQATQPVSGTFWQATQPVSLASVPTHPVTQSGTWNIGSITTLPALPANQSTNISQINGVTPLMGNGIAGTGAQRVTIASDNTAFTVNAAQSGTWNIGNITGTQTLPTGASTESTLSIIRDRIPTGLTTASNRLAVYSPDSIRVFATNGFGGVSSGGTSLDATDSTNLALSADSNFQRRGVVILGGSITAAAGATTVTDSTITRVSMTVTNLHSLANSATAGWGSDSVTNYRKASDYRISVSLTMANTAPANDRAAYVYISPIYNNNGTWETSSQGTTTLPTLTQGTTTIAQPNNLRLLGVLSYTTQNMVLRDTWSLSEIFPVMPEGFKIIITNFTGAAIAASGSTVSYTPIFKTQR